MTKADIPNLDQVWINEFGYQDEESIELYLLEINAGVID